MALYKGQQKITPVKVVKKGGDYYVEQVNNADGTCILNITDADSVNKWKEYYTHMIQRDTDTIVVPDGVESIGNYAFYEYRTLANINLPDNLKSVGVSSFDRCMTLNLKQLPNSLTSIGSSGFKDCRLCSVKSLPSGITLISSSAFEWCTSLSEMTFFGDITKINSYAFLNSDNLTKFSFPNNTVVPILDSVLALPHGANFTGQIAIPNTLYNSWTTASNWSSLTKAQWVRFINSWDELITAEGDYALFNDTSLTDVRHLVPTAQTYNVTLHNYADMFILNGNPTVEQNSEYVVTIEKTDRVEWPAEVAVLPTYTPYITINGVEVSSDNYTTVTTTYRDNTYPTTITIKPNVINGDVDISLIYSDGSVGGEWDTDPFI